ncbi:MAG: hypothetical protein ACKO23_11955 [Gemmataceae bacterium]
MWKRILSGLIALTLCVGSLFAAEGEVISYAKAKLVVKVEGKERTIEFIKGRPHLHAADGKLIKLKDYPKYLKKGVKVDIEEDEGKVMEVMLKE